jgi:hypothetical protein
MTRALLFLIFFGTAIGCNEHDHALEWLKLYGTPGSFEAEMAELEAT